MVSRTYRRAVAREISFHRRKLAALVSEILRRQRPQRCDRHCRGWFIDEETLEPTICDDCARLNGYQNTIGDDEIKLLPMATRAWRRSVEAEHVRY